MRIDPLVVAIGAMICLMPVLLGLLVDSWPLPWIAPKREMAMRDEGDLLAAEPPHDHCDCPACEFWRDWHREVS